MILFQRLSLASEVALAFITASQQVDAMFHAIRELSESPIASSTIQELDKEVKQTRKQWAELQSTFPEIFSEMQTRHVEYLSLHLHDGLCVMDVHNLDVLSEK